MSFNPMQMLKLKDRISIFQQQHPRVLSFLQQINEQNVVREGTIVEVQITDPDGRNYVTNIRLTPEDIESLQILRNTSY